MNIDEEIMQEFLVEAGELFDMLNDQFVELEKTPQDLDLINAIFRAYHTIKGGAGFMKLEPMVEVCHRAEDAMNQVRQGEREVTAELIDILFQTLDELDGMFSCVRGGGELPDADAGLLQLLDQLLGKAAAEVPVAVEAPPAQSEPVREESAQVEIQAETQGAEIQDMDSEFEAMLNAAQINKEKTADSGLISDDEFEAALDQIHGKGKGPGSSATKVAPQAAVTPIKSEAPSKTETANKAAAPTKATAPVAESSVRVDTERLDDIMNLVGELVLVRNRLSTLKQVVKQESVVEAISTLDLVTSDLQSSVMKTRMQPIKKVFSRFPRVIRDLARKLKKDINLELIGEETDLDKSLVDSLADPLIHLVRNAADHGIETPEERYESGKSRQGTVKLSAQQEGDQILLIVSDDGKGMDPDALRVKAVDSDLMNEDMAKNLSDKEAYNLIFAPGFSTKTEISDVSGRGVGMDVVKTRINELSGTIEIDSKLGEGSVITIHLPLTLAILPTLMVGLGAYQFALPLSNVYEAFNMEKDWINHVDGQEVMRVRDKTLPLFYLRPWLVKNQYFDESAAGCKVVVVQMGTKRFCLVVDSIVGQEEVVIKPLGAMLTTTPGFSGATITGDGSIALVLDMPSLMGKYATNNAVF